MPKQSSVRWTGKVRLDVRNGRFVKYTNNKINSAESYPWYLDSQHTALGEINSTRICAFPIEAYWICYFEDATTGRWPLPRRPLWCNYVAVGRVWWVASGVGLINYTVTQLMHSECGRICRGAVGEGGLIRGGLYSMSTFTFRNKSDDLVTIIFTVAGLGHLHFHLILPWILQWNSQLSLKSSMMVSIYV